MLFLLRANWETVNSNSNVNSEWQSHRTSNWKALAKSDLCTAKKNLLNWLGSSRHNLKPFPSLFPSASRSYVSYGQSFVLCRGDPSVGAGGVGESIQHRHFSGLGSAAHRFWKPASQFFVCSLKSLCTHYLHGPLRAWPMCWNPWDLACDSLLSSSRSLALLWLVLGNNSRTINLIHLRCCCPPPHKAFWHKEETNLGGWFPFCQKLTFKRKQEKEDADPD